MTVLLIYFVVIFGIVFTYLYKKFGRKLALCGALGGPPAYPIVGNGLLFAGKTPSGMFENVKLILIRLRFNVYFGNIFYLKGMKM